MNRFQTAAAAFLAVTSVTACDRTDPASGMPPGQIMERASELSEMVVKYKEKHYLLIFESGRQNTIETIVELSRKSEIEHEAWQSASSNRMHGIFEFEPDDDFGRFIDEKLKAGPVQMFDQYEASLAVSPSAGP